MWKEMFQKKIYIDEKKSKLSTVSYFFYNEPGKKMLEKKEKEKKKKRKSKKIFISLYFLL